MQRRRVQSCPDKQRILSENTGVSLIRKASFETIKGGFSHTPGGDRTYDLLLRRQALYPLSYGRVSNKRMVSEFTGSVKNKPAKYPFRVFCHISSSIAACKFTFGFSLDKQRVAPYTKSVPE